ncbi:MAG: hemolysin III family protein [Verrucomicrobiota bacterium]
MTKKTFLPFLRVYRPNQSANEELANTVTHGIGALLSLASLVSCVIFASAIRTEWHIVSFSIYGSSLFLLYSISTVYHSLPASKAKSLFQMLDHCAIYVFIAGCYTPLTLIALRGVWGYTLLGIIWPLAIVGIGMEFYFRLQDKKPPIFLYVLMGWLICVALRPIIEYLPTAGIVLFITGGLSYTIGIFFYKAKQIPYNHAIWHLFVMLGSILHFICYFCFLLLPA